MKQARVQFDAGRTVGKIDDRLYGSFIEHLGRAVYTGIYEPTHPTADEKGFRGDVAELVKSLNVPIVRYPGGNFVSGFKWEDSVGKNRPRRLDLAWHTIEPNEVGVHEFADWCEKVGAEIMMAVNLGTRGMEEAREFLEYCNFPAGTALSDMRIKNGRKQPFGIKTWCLGNEMDGEWQMGHKTAHEYGRLASETAKLMREIDPSIELVACGSSNKAMPTFGSWEREVLDNCYNEIDYLSLHQYYGPPSDHRSFLTMADEMSDFIEEVVDICDEVGARKHSSKKLGLSFDEWNVWYHSNESDKSIPKWQLYRPLLEDIYNFEDAVVLATMMNTLINHSDRVKIACLAQLVNVIAPIMTAPGGGVFKQTIFYPYYYGSVYGRGTALRAEVDSPTYSCEKFSSASAVHTAGVLNNRGELFTSIVNRSGDDLEIEVELKGLKAAETIEYSFMQGQPLAVNSFDNPDNVRPVPGQLTLTKSGFKLTAPKETIHFVRVRV